MKDLVPAIHRQRLIIEGIYSGRITRKMLREFMAGLAKRLGMTIVFGPKIMQNAQKLDPKYTGYEAITVWAESGVTLYTWELYNFFTIDIYSCKPYNYNDAVDYATDFFKTVEIQWKFA
jgi:S-adenosylmethionine decarboxylase